jgi:ABC-type branched-subunit amino acid transport system ATPase component
MALTFAYHIYIIDKGSVVYDGKPEDLRNDHEAQQKWLGV